MPSFAEWTQLFNTGSFLVVVLVVCIVMLVVFLRAYLTAKGTALAQSEDIKKLLSQTQALTTITESIKAEVGHGVWKQQQLVTLKVQAYGRINEAMGLMMQSITSLMTTLIFLKTANPEQISAASTQLVEHLSSLVRETTNCHSAFEGAAPFISPEASAELALVAMTDPPAHVLVNPDSPDELIELFSKKLQRFITHMKNVNELAKQDMGLAQSTASK
jgi:hypothetical protein